MDTYKTIFENNRQWVKRKTGEDKDFFKKLVKEQNPDLLYIGCSDSRVTAEKLIVPTAKFPPLSVFPVTTGPPESPGLLHTDKDERFLICLPL